MPIAEEDNQNRCRPGRKWSARSMLPSAVLAVCHSAYSSPSAQHGAPSNSAERLVPCQRGCSCSRRAKSAASGHRGRSPRRQDRSGHRALQGDGSAVAKRDVGGELLLSLFKSLPKYTQGFFTLIRFVSNCRNRSETSLNRFSQQNKWTLKNPIENF